ncbi:MAG: 1-phosphofructokinase family hexose kinase [Oscillospiraceae bacterium]|nr:1-phosphofructokinase family hexose kinase [Oscillospiraceae bacterium]
MIYTVTFNPALDYTARLGTFKLGEINRTLSGSISVGGKGINVSRMLSILGHENVAMGFAAGFTGEEIVRIVKASGFGCDFIMVEEGLSRINVKLMMESETEINGRGPVVEDKHIHKLEVMLEKLTEGDVLILAGSVPPSVSLSVYGRILSSVASKGVLTVVDAEGGLLTKSLEYKPFLIKPNIKELSGLFKNAAIADKDTAVVYARLLRELGARNILTSMAGDGAVLLTECGHVIKCAAPKGAVVSSVGAGDAMTAGFIAGWLQTKDYEYALRLGIAAGSASAFSKNGLDKADVDKMMFNAVLEE